LIIIKINLDKIPAINKENFSMPTGVVAIEVYKIKKIFTIEFFL